MLAYAADTPRAAGRAGSPKALTLIITGHALVLAAVLTAKPELVGIQRDPPPIVINIPDPPKPDPTVEKDRQRPDPKDTIIDRTPALVPVEQTLPPIALDPGPATDEIGKLVGTGPAVVPDPPRHVPVMVAARWATAEGSVKPPYPLDKIRAGEEATLRLRLTIDARGRVVAVDPVGPADLSFLEAARKHILRVWRYKPAMEDGVAMPSSTVISLSFRLEDV